MDFIGDKRVNFWAWPDFCTVLYGTLSVPWNSTFPFDVRVTVRRVVCFSNSVPQSRPNIRHHCRRSNCGNWHGLGLILTVTGGDKVRFVDYFCGLTAYYARRTRVIKLYTVKPRFTNAPVHEQFGSRTFFPSQKTSRMTNGVSDYEHASWQQRQAESIGAGVSVAD
jgi:hypothetical protein